VLVDGIEGGSGLVIVTDQNTRSDMGASMFNHKPHVHAFSKLGRDMLGAAWKKATRIALFSHGERPGGAQRAHARTLLQHYICAAKPRCIVVLPTPSATMLDPADKAASHGTVCWDALSPPDNLDAMRGAFWEFCPGTLVVPVFPLVPTIKEMQKMVMARWLHSAEQVARGTSRVLSPQKLAITVGPDMLATMRGMRDKHLAIDIETIPNQDVITAIGLSAGDDAVSMPWDGYMPSGEPEPQPPLGKDGDDGQVRALLAELLAAPTAKVLQNGVYDLPQLRARGLTVNGPAHDTLALHAIAYPELRHALQFAAATQLCVPPWKAVFKAGAWKKDDPEFWFYRPLALREYNALDAFYTGKLFADLAPKMGVLV
jgi:hypothetical protein